MSDVQEQQGRVLEMVDSLSVSTQAALTSLEARLLALQARVDSCLPGLPHPASSPFFCTLHLHPTSAPYFCPLRYSPPINLWLSDGPQVVQT